MKAFKAIKGAAAAALLTTAQMTSGATTPEPVPSPEPGTDPRLRLDLPAGYIQMTKLKSTGNERIDTDFIPSSTTATEFEFGEVTVDDSQRTFFGQDWDYYRYLFKVKNRTFYFNGNDTSIVKIETDGRDYSVTIAPTTSPNGTLTVIDKSTGESTAKTLSLSANDSIKLSIFSYAKGMNYPGKFALYSLKFWDDGEPAADFVPVWKISTSEAGLYDFVSGNFYASASATAFARQPAVERLRLAFEDTKLVATVEPSESEQTILLYAGEEYGGVDGWGEAVQTNTVPANSTTTVFDKPTGWGKTVWYARAVTGEGALAAWSKTVIAEPPAPIGIGSTLVLASSVFGSSEIAATVTGIGMADSATLTFAYGTTPDLSDGTVEVTVNEIGTWRGTLPHLVAGQTYYVQATLDNHIDSPVQSGMRPFDQPDIFEPGLNPRIRTMPEGYIQMTKLKSTGKEYVQTEFAPTPLTDTEFEFGELGSGNVALFTTGWAWGSQYGFKMNGSLYFFPKKVALIPAAQNCDYRFTVTATGDGEKTTVFVTNKTNGASATLTNQVVPTQETPFGVFATSGGSFSGTFALYFLKFFQDGEIAADFVPAWSIAEEKAGLYDFKSGNFYTSATTTPFAQQAFLAGISLEPGDAGLVVTTLASSESRTVSLYAGADYGGVDGWGNPIATATLDPNETSVTFSLPEGWGKTVWFARVHVGDGETDWSKTLIAADANRPSATLADARALGTDKFVLSGTLDSFVGESCTVTPVVTDSSGAAIDFSAAAKAFDAPGEFAFGLPASIAAGETYSVCVEMAADGKKSRSKTLSVTVGTAGALTPLGPGETAPIEVAVEGVPDARTTVAPAYGRYAAEENKVYSFSAPTSASVDGREYSLLGYEIYEGETLTASGEGNAFTFATDRGGFRVVWKWDVVYTTTVTVPDERHGKASARQPAVAHGGTARFTATPDEGYAVAWTGEGVPNELMFESELVLEGVQGPVNAVATFFIPSANEGEKTGLFATYAHSTPITFAGYDGTTVLTNFPALIRVREGDGGFSYAGCTADGRDVRFCGADGRELASEVVKFDKNGTSEFWVKVLALSPRRTRIYLVWGNASATERPLAVHAWDKSYRGVWSMEPYGCLVLDRSPWDNHGACNGSKLGSVAGVVGGARRFAGEWSGTPRVGTLDSAVLKPASFLAECWFRPSAYPANDRGFLMALGRLSDPLFGLKADGTLVGASAGSGLADCVKSPAAVSLNDWHQAAFSYDGATGEQRLYLDGVCVDSKIKKIASEQKWGDSENDNSFPSIGGRENGTGGASPNTDGYFLGDIDEVRLSDATRNADYVRATYLNVASNATFAVFDGDYATLTVDGEPQQLAPMIGVTAPEIAQGGVRRTCTGYAVVADGKLIDSGEGASVSRAWPTKAANVAIAWNWKTEYEVSVDGVSGWYEAGTVLPVAAGAAPAGQAFHSWSGNCPTLEVFSASFDLPVDGPRTLTSVYGTLVEVTTNGCADAAEAGVALTNALTAAVAAAEPTVVTIGDGVYDCVYAATFEVANALVIRSASGAAETVVNQMVDKPRLFKLNHPRCALVGLTLVGMAGNGVNSPAQVLATKGHLLDCVFKGPSGRFVYTNGFQLQQDGGWCRRCVFFDPPRSDAQDTSRAGHGMAAFTRTLVDSCLVTNVYCHNANVCPLACWAATLVRNTVVAHNSPRVEVGINGGGVNVADANVRIENCTIADNRNSRKSARGSYGAGLYASTPVVVVNTIFDQNVNFDSDDGDDFYGPVGFANSISKDLTDGAYRSIVSPAAFAENDDGTYHPRATSLSVDAGYPAGWTQAPGARDFGGEARLCGAATDIGAREYHPTGDEDFEVSVSADALSGLDAQTVNFSATVVGAKGELTFVWDFGDGIFVTNDVPAVSHAYTHAGYYTVTLTVTDESTKDTAVFSSANMIKIKSSTCYICSAGSQTEPYDTPAKGAASILDVIGLKPSKIVVCADSTSDRTGNGSDTLCNLDYAVELVGEDPVSSVIADRVHVNHASAVMRDLTCTSSKYQQSTDIGTFAVTAGLVSNVTFTGCCPIPRSTPDREVLKVYAGGRVVDSRFCGNNPLYADLRPRVWAKGASAIGIYDGGALVDRCVVTNNLGGSAKGTYAAGIKVMGDYTPAPVIRNSLIAGNVCGDGIPTNTIGGAGIYAKGAVAVENCTIVTNVTAGTGAAIYATASGLTVVNTIIASNAGGMTNAAEICSNEVYVAEGASATWQKSRVPAEAGIAGEGVTTADPKFNLGGRTSEPYWALRGTSPCKNKGVKLGWMDGATDLSGQKRVFNGKPDLGCYESQIGGTVIIVR